MICNALQAEVHELVFRDSLAPLDECLLEGGPFDVIIIDLHHPVEACFGLLATIKRMCPRTEVIFLSRWADEDLWIESIQRGAYDFVPKPLDRRELHRILTNAIEKNRADASNLNN